MSGAFTIAVRIVLGGLFLASGAAKILDPVRFLFTLRGFRLLPGFIEPFLALCLPWLETVLGTLVLVGLFLRTSALLLAGLNVAFTAAIVSVIARGITIDCGCFGLLADFLPLPDMADYKAVIRDLIFAAMCLYLYRAGGSLLTLDGFLAQRRGGGESA